MVRHTLDKHIVFILCACMMFFVDIRRFIQVLWLKTSINILYTFGSAQSWDWHVWMHVPSSGE